MISLTRLDVAFIRALAGRLVSSFFFKINADLATDREVLTLSRSAVVVKLLGWGSTK
jgi:hypothetical protein